MIYNENDAATVKLYSSKIFAMQIGSSQTQACIIQQNCSARACEPAAAEHDRCIIAGKPCKSSRVRYHRDAPAVLCYTFLCCSFYQLQIYVLI